MSGNTSNLLEQPRLRNMARVALRLPNDKMVARENFVRITLLAGHKTWGDFIEAGLARKRRPEPGASDKVAVYELTEAGIAAVLESGESRGSVTVSPEDALMPLSSATGAEPLSQVHEAPTGQVPPSASVAAPSEVMAVEKSCVPIPTPADSLEARAQKVITSSEVPEWAREVVSELLESIREQGQSPDIVAKPREHAA